MNGSDRKKVLDAGFTILRLRDYHPVQGSTIIELPYQIYYDNSTGGWALYKNHKYHTRAQRDRILKEILKNPKIIVE